MFEIGDRVIVAFCAFGRVTITGTVMARITFNGERRYDVLFDVAQADAERSRAASYANDPKSLSCWWKELELRHMDPVSRLAELGGNRV